MLESRARPASKLAQTMGLRNHFKGTASCQKCPTVRYQLPVRDRSGAARPWSAEPPLRVSDRLEDLEVVTGEAVGDRELAREAERGGAFFGHGGGARNL